MPQAEIRIDGGDCSDELAALWEYLHDDAVIGGALRRSGRPAGPIDLGGPSVELLSVALGSGGAGAVLAQSLANSLATWLRTRRSDITLIVSVGDRTAQLKAEKLRSGHAEEALRIALSVLRETLADKDD